jgi:GAF domain-containing protein
LGGAAVSTRRSVVVGDVTRDRRYLTTFGTTRSEMVVPVCDCDGAVTGLIDVESALVDAFGDSDRTALEACARAVGPLFGQRDSDS